MQFVELFREYWKLQDSFPESDGRIIVNRAFAAGRRAAFACELPVPRDNAIAAAYNETRGCVSPNFDGEMLSFSADHILAHPMIGRTFRLLVLAKAGVEPRDALLNCDGDQVVSSINRRLITLRKTGKLATEEGRPERVVEHGVDGAVVLREITAQDTGSLFDS